MSDKFRQLQVQLERMLNVLDTLKKENRTLKGENAGIKEELTRLRQEVNRLQRQNNDQAEAVRTRLSAVLAQVEELESSVP